MRCDSGDLSGRRGPIDSIATLFYIEGGQAATAVKLVSALTGAAGRCGSVNATRIERVAALEVAPAGGLP